MITVKCQKWDQATAIRAIARRHSATVQKEDEDDAYVWLAISTNDDPTPNLQADIAAVTPAYTVH